MTTAVEDIVYLHLGLKKVHMLVVNSTLVINLDFKEQP
jgi:hypothetical protein